MNLKSTLRNANDSFSAFIFEADLHAPVEEVQFQDLIHLEEIRKSMRPKTVEPPKGWFKIYLILSHTIHFKMMQLQISLRLWDTTLYHVLKLNQDTWLKPYVGLNFKERQQLKIKTSVELLQAGENSCNGTRLENRQNCVMVKMVERRSLRKIDKHLFNSIKIVDKNVAKIPTKKSGLFWNRPEVVGASIVILADEPYALVWLWSSKTFWLSWFLLRYKVSAVWKKTRFLQIIGTELLSWKHMLIFQTKLKITPAQNDSSQVSGRV